jgi:holo-[acyl-carrier protein] synthase
VPAMTLAMPPLIHGIDIVEIARIRRMLEEYGPRFLDRCFTPQEQAYCRSKADPAPHLAARFAAKEATLKALGTGLSDGIRWTDVAIEHSDVGKPILRLSGRAMERSTDHGLRGWVVSLSHSGTMAVASVIGQRSD